MFTPAPLFKGFQIDGAFFDGSFGAANGYMLRGGNLTGMAGFKTGIASIWCNIRVNELQIFLAGDLTLPFRFDWASSRFRVYGENAADAQILNLRSNTNVAHNTGWHHALISFDLNFSDRRFVYIDDVADTEAVGTSGHNNDTVRGSSTDWGVGANINGSFKAGADFADLYVAFGNPWFDISVLANRRKFISENRTPVFLGADGSLPTGTAPIVHCHLNRGEAVTNFATNRGTGGNFTITNTLSTSPTSPSN